jgi:predicted RNA-binding protein YlqC (UPF0109 family)
MRSLFDEYIEMYASRGDRLTARLPDDTGKIIGKQGRNASLRIIVS